MYENLSDEALRQTIMQERSLMTKAKQFGNRAGYDAAKQRLEAAEAELKQRESRKAKSYLVVGRPPGKRRTE